MKVAAEEEPEIFTKVARDPLRMEAMDEELQALNLRSFHTTSLCQRLEGEELKLSKKG